MNFKLLLAAVVGGLATAVVIYNRSQNEVWPEKEDIDKFINLRKKDYGDYIYSWDLEKDANYIRTFNPIIQERICASLAYGDGSAFWRRENIECLREILKEKEEDEV